MNNYNFIHFILCPQVRLVNYKNSIGKGTHTCTVFTYGHNRIHLTVAFDRPILDQRNLILRDCSTLHQSPIHLRLN